LNLERTERKSIPVRPRVTGRPASGFEIAGVASDPPEGRVAGPRSRGREIGGVASAPPEVRGAGPRSRVREIESAFTEPVSVEGASNNASEAVGVGLGDPLLRLRGRSRRAV